MRKLIIILLLPLFCQAQIVSSISGVTAANVSTISGVEPCPGIDEVLTAGFECGGPVVECNLDTNIILNGGGLSETDWNDSNSDSLADYWGIWVDTTYYPGYNGNGIYGLFYRIYIGGGFTDKYQRVYFNVEEYTAAGISCNPFESRISVDSVEYQLSVTYLCNAKLTVFGVFTDGSSVVLLNLLKSTSIPTTSVVSFKTLNTEERKLSYITFGHSQTVGNFQMDIKLDEVTLQECAL